MTDQLIVLLDGRQIGKVRRATKGELSFHYDPTWRAARETMPLSLSMPLAETDHGDAMISAFIWGLLPDNALVLDRWARRFHVSPRSPFGLIAHVGEDCAGAVQFVRPERLAAVLAAGDSEITWLSTADVAERLRTLRQDQAAWRLPRDTGQFSLAGAQAKTAFLLRGDRWGVPSARLPTTHILKPQSEEFDGHAENEHFCLTLARALGLPAAGSNVRRFGDEAAIVIERYDRVSLPDGRIARIHQEDICQALGLMPTLKYQSDGGPAPPQIVDLLSRHSSRPAEDIATFIDALIFNWLIGGTDAHAKNYSLLHGPRGGLRLAPLYDVASALPYDRFDERKLKLAMKIGRDYVLANIGLRQWRKAEQELHRTEGELVMRARAFGQALLRQLPVVAGRMRDEALRHPVIERLVVSLGERAARCVEGLRD